MKPQALLLMLGALTACGGDEATPTDTAVAPDSAAPGDTAGPADDTAAPADTLAPLDTAGPLSDGTAPTDTAPTTDAQTGTKAVGEPCTADGECASDICLSSPYGRACTAPCQAEADCDGFPIGMFCLPVRPGVAGCVPEAVAVPPSCDSHGDCAYPLYCRFDAVGCDLPQCLHDGDCPADQRCEAQTRRCAPAVCHDDVDCRHPSLVCHTDGTCGAPACTTDAACGALPAYCHPVQRACKTATACTKPEECFYNETCTGGFCLPNLCYAGCQGGKTCDPATGWCGATCTTIGQSTCASGEACLSTAGVCAPNTPPIAAAAASANGLPVAVVPVGAPASLTAAASVDPEGEALSYRWTLREAPLGSAHTAGAAVGAAVTAAFTPDVAGRYVIGLYARDPAGVDSIEAAVTLVAQ